MSNKYDSAFKEIISIAVKTSGCYAEIYHYRVMEGVLEYLENLDENEAEIFKLEAIQQGFDFDESSLREKKEEHDAMWDEIRREQE